MSDDAQLSGSPADLVFELPAGYRYGALAVAAFVGCATVLFVARWATNRPGDYLGAVFLLTFAVVMAVWPYRSGIRLTSTSLVELNMWTRVIPYRDIQAAEVRVRRAPVVVLNMASGKKLTLGSSVGPQTYEIAAAINQRLASS